MDSSVMSRLAKQLKKICENHGTKYKERIDSLEHSATIFHELSLRLYMDKIPDKLSLIQSAALMNAAIARVRYDEEWMKQLSSDLDDLCSHVLNAAHAKKLNANLVQISNDIAKKITIMRKTAAFQQQTTKILKSISYEIDPAEQKSLENQKILYMQRIQTRISQSYTKIMNRISKKCEGIMGNAPCKYAVVGMGSLARKEITPYSDFEHVIVLEEGVQHKEDYEAVLEYFRWFSVIFQIIIINLQETIIPSVGIPCLNDFYSNENDGDWFFDAFTKRGISFDGHMPKACKFPLGRMKETEDEPWTVELIQPISGMIAFLSPEQNLKGGYCLGDMLTNTCFVSGDESVYQEFADQVKITENQNQESNYTKIMNQLSIDLKNFDAYKNLHELRAVSSWNIKRVIYRSSTLFISALGQLHLINECSCFDIIAKLKVNNLIDDETAHRLSYAVAIACQVRLHIYMEKQSQDDNVDGDNVQNDETLSFIYVISSFLGDKSLVDYFEIVYSLQKEISTTTLELTRKFELKYEPITKFIILSLFNFIRQLLREWESHHEGNQSGFSNEDKWWIIYYVARAYRKKGEYVKALAHYDQIIDQVSDPWLKGSLLVGKSTCLDAMGRCKDAILYIEEKKQEIEKMDLTESQKHLCSLLNVLGYCHVKQKKYEEALAVFKQVEEYVRNDSCGMHDNIELALVLGNIARCLLFLDKYEEGLEKIEKAFKIYENSNASDEHKLKCEKLFGLLKSALSDKDKWRVEPFSVNSICSPVRLSYCSQVRMPRTKDELDSD